jgi:hypothetical protein
LAGELGPVTVGDTNQIPPHALWTGHAGDGRDYRRLFEVDAVSARDIVRNEFPLTFTAPRKPSVLTGRAGGDPKVKIDLRSDDGPIEILQDVGETPTPESGTSY